MDRYIFLTLKLRSDLSRSTQTTNFSTKICFQSWLLDPVKKIKNLTVDLIQLQFAIQSWCGCDEFHISIFCPNP